MDRLIIGGSPIGNPEIATLLFKISNDVNKCKLLCIGASVILGILHLLNYNFNTILNIYSGLWNLSIGTDVIFTNRDNNKLYKVDIVIKYLKIFIKPIKLKDFDPNFKFITYNLSKMNFQYFDLNTNPEMTLLECIQVSIGIPEYFSSVIFLENHYIDPSYINSIPIQFINSICDGNNKNTMLLYLSKKPKNVLHHLERWTRMAPILENEKMSLLTNNKNWYIITSPCHRISPKNISYEKIGIIISKILIS